MLGVFSAREKDIYQLIRRRHMDLFTYECVNVTYEFVNAEYKHGKLISHCFLVAPFTLLAFSYFFNVIFLWIEYST